MTATKGVTLAKAAAVGSLGVAGVVVLLYAFKIWPFQQDEPGIRVKNGSAYLETVSGVGFVAVGQNFESKRGAKPCFRLEVFTTQSCSANVRELDEVVRVVFTTTDRRRHAIQAQGRFKTQLLDTWSLKNADKIVEREDSRLGLETVEAIAKGGKTLSCTFGSSKTDDWFLLDSVKTTC